MWKEVRMVFVLVLMLAMVLTLTACGGNENKAEVYRGTLWGQELDIIVDEKDVVLMSNPSQSINGTYMENGKDRYTLTYMGVDFDLTLQEDGSWKFQGLQLKQVGKFSFEDMRVHNSNSAITKTCLELNPKNNTYSMSSTTIEIVCAGPFSYGDAQLFCYGTSSDIYGIVYQGENVQHLYSVGDLTGVYEVAKNDENKLTIVEYSDGEKMCQLADDALVGEKMNARKVGEGIYSTGEELILLYDGKVIRFDTEYDDMGEYYEDGSIVVTENKVAICLDNEEMIIIRKEKDKMFLPANGGEIEFSRVTD